jgi:NADH dehydrogenase FAD-containing subunit
MNVQKLPFDKTKQKRIAVDDFLRVMIGGKPADGLYAIGDCAGTLPQLAAVAERQAKYLAEMLNRIMKEPRTTISRDGQNMVTVEGQPVYCSDVASPFKYRHLGSMVSIGGRKALVDLPYKRFNMKGFLVASWPAATYPVIPHNNRPGLSGGPRT